jgi:hypothetical protein
MKTVSAVEARKGLGRLLNLVSLKNETIVIERAGEKLAILKAYDSSSLPTKRPPPSGQLALRDLAGVGSEIWAGVDANEYIGQERAQWD